MEDWSNGFLDIAEDVESFPNKRAAWIITDQILRGSASISANISEGFGRKTRDDYEHFLASQEVRQPKLKTGTLAVC